MTAHIPENEVGGFTPGPWQNGIDDLEGVVSIAPVGVVGDGNVVCLPPDYGMVASRERWLANANLIAAAPDMYEALERACRALDVFAPQLVDAIAECNAALAKARGR